MRPGRVSGLPLDPMFSATKAQVAAGRARSRPHPQPGAAELCLGTVDSWLLSRFGGEHLIEVGNASRTQLLDIRTWRWDPRTARSCSASRPRCCRRVVPSTGPFPTAAGLGPLADGTPVAAVLGDSHAALFAHAGWRPGSVKATYGTGSSVMAPATRQRDGAAGLCLHRRLGRRTQARVRASRATSGPAARR